MLNNCSLVLVLHNTEECGLLEHEWCHLRREECSDEQDTYNEHIILMLHVITSLHATVSGQFHLLLGVLPDRPFNVACCSQGLFGI